MCKRLSGMKCSRCLPALAGVLATGVLGHKRQDLFGGVDLRSAFHCDFQRFHRLAVSAFTKVVMYQLVSHAVRRATSGLPSSEACCKKGLGFRVYGVQVRSRARA